MTSEPTGPRDPIADAMSELRDEQPRVPSEPADRYWLRVGLALGLQRPGRAQLLLERLEHAVGVVAAATPEDDGSGTGEPVGGSAGEPVGDAAEEPVGDSEEVPLRSMLLARSATLPRVDKEAFDPEAVFGWAGRLTRDEVLWMGRVLQEMLAEGMTPDLAKGFAIAWRAGLKLPESDFDVLFHAFTELELTVGGVLAGYDLRAEAGEAKQGLLGSMLGSLLRGNTRGAEAGGILERAGEPGRRGLVAMWNAWAAMRFRPQVPEVLFEQLVRPWITVVGRLPDATP